MTLIQLIKSDLFRYYGKCDITTFFRAYIFIPGFHYTVWFRLASYIQLPLLRQFIKWRLFKKSITFGIEILPHTEIGAGLYIGHWGGIVIHPEAKLGTNCNISQGVVIGYVARGKHKGIPTIGNNVYIAPGAKIIGNVAIGHNVAIGTNAVVTSDISPFSVAVGIPAKVISQEGSLGYICNPYQ